LRHTVSIGAPLKLRKVSGPVESAAWVEKEVTEVKEPEEIKEVKEKD
jgi:hypothetical protein